MVATRVGVTADKIGNAVSVIQEEDIRSSQTILASDLLATTPGIAFDRSGGPGTTTAVRIRGAESAHTLVLLDGVVVNDPSQPAAGYDFSSLLVGDIARVEILRGSQSTLYGSQAIGGVINLISREPQESLSGEVQGEAGSYQTGTLKAAIGGRADRLTFRLAAGQHSTDGISAFAGGTETDPYRNTTFSGRVRYGFSDNVELDLRGYYNEDKNHYDGYPAPAFVLADEGDYNLNRRSAAYAGLNFSLFGDRLANRLAYQSTHSRRRLLLDSGTAVVETGRYEGENARFEYQGTWSITQGYQLVFGAQHEESEMESLVSPRHADVGQRSAYAQLQAGIFDGVTLTLGQRYDDHDSYGSHSTSQAALAWSLGTGTILRASWGEGYKSPSLYQLFSEYANPALRPETSTGWDAGIEQSWNDGRVNVSATYFDRDTDDQIDFVSCFTSPVDLCSAPGHSDSGYYLNVDRAEAHGVELQATVALTSALAVSANYTDMRVTDRSPGSGTFGQQLQRRPKTLLNASVSYAWPFALTTTLAARHVGSSTDMNFDVFPSETVILDSYTVVDFRASYPLTQSVTLYGRLENAFDESYQTAYGFGSMGRGAYAGISARF